jgi:hypothetical protein
MNFQPIVPEFFMILEELGINRDNIGDLDEKGIIRIEKKLKARSKMSGAFDNQANENILNAIKKHHRAIVCFYTDEMLYHLSHGKKFKGTEFISFYPIDKEDLERVKLFFEECLADDFLDKVQKCFSSNQIVEIYKWHLTEQIFSATFKQKLSKVLKAKFEFIIETFKQMLPSDRLEKRLNFAKNRYFYMVLAYHKDDELTRLVHDLLSFYNNHSFYTKGMDFADSVLLNLNEYDRDDFVLGLNIMATTMNAGGSYKVMMIAILVILGILFGPIIYLVSTHKPSLPKPFKMPTEEGFGFGRDIESQFKANRNVVNSSIAYNYVSNTDSLVIKSESSRMAQLAGYKFKLDSVIPLKTGDYLLKARRGSFNQELPQTPEKFYFVNRTSNHVFLLLYFNQCMFREFDVLHPCPYPFAWNEMYVKPHDYVALSANVLDYLSIQTGKNLVVLSRTIEQLEDEPERYFLWVKANKVDTFLYRQNFVNVNAQNTQGGRFVLTASNNKYQINWIGKEKAIFHKEEKEYLKPNQALVIEYKKKKNRN